MVSLATTPSIRRNQAEPDGVEIVVQGDLTAGATAAARRRIAALARYTREPITHARVPLVRVTDPAVTRPVIAQANVHVGGELVRAQVAARTTGEALDLLQARLRQRLLRVVRRWETRRAQRARHCPEYARPEEERELRRRKTYGPTYATPEEAALDMDLLDYDFYLFTDSQTGQDAVVYGPALPDTGWPSSPLPPRPGPIGRAADGQRATGRAAGAPAGDRAAEPDRRPRGAAAGPPPVRRAADGAADRLRDAGVDHSTPPRRGCPRPFVVRASRYCRYFSARSWRSRCSTA